jgi:hypothetical protein
MTVSISQSLCAGPFWAPVPGSTGEHRVNVLRELVPHAVRRGISAQVARVKGARLERDLARLADGRDTIVAGPWLGEVGFELLYWVPFLRWFATRFQVSPERLLVVSRGGTHSWYQPFAQSYRDIFDYLTPDEFRRKHEERVATTGEQKQRRVLAFEHELLRQLTPDIRSRRMLHPSTMYELFNPFWWMHTDDSWVMRYVRYHRLDPGAAPSDLPSEPYTAVKFYFNDCFPATEANRAFVRCTIERLAAQGPVVSLTTGLQLDDHGGYDAGALGVRPFPADVSPRENLALQTAIVARATALVGTYGGFSYLAPFLGVRSIAYYGDPNGFSRRHLMMVRSALQTIGAANLLEVRPISTSTEDDL